MRHHVHLFLPRLLHYLWPMLLLIGLCIFANRPAQAQDSLLHPALQQLSGLLERQTLSDAEIENFFPANNAEDVVLFAFNLQPRADSPYNLFQEEIDIITPEQARLAAKRGLSFMFTGNMEHFLKQYLAQANPASAPDEQTRFTSQGVNYLFSIRVHEDEITAERLVFDIVINTEVNVEEWGIAESAFFYTFSFEHNILKLVGMNMAG